MGVTGERDGSKVTIGLLPSLALSGPCYKVSVIEATTLEVCPEGGSGSLILVSAQQQVAGVDQVAVAMQNIQQASTQTMASTRQVELAAQDLNALAQRLKALVAASGNAQDTSNSREAGEGKNK